MLFLDVNFIDSRLLYFLLILQVGDRAGFVEFFIAGKHDGAIGVIDFGCREFLSRYVDFFDGLIQLGLGGVDLLIAVSGD